MHIQGEESASMNFRKAIIFFALLLSAVVSYAQLNTARVMEIGRNALYFEDYVLSIQYFNKVNQASNMILVN